VAWLVDLALGVSGWEFVLSSPRAVEDRREISGGVRGSFRMYPMQMADANDSRGGQQD
jgi:hypothetical protein